MMGSGESIEGSSGVSMTVYTGSPVGKNINENLGHMRYYPACSYHGFPMIIGSGLYIFLNKHNQ